MSVFNLVLLILALVCFLVAAIAGHAGPADGRPAGWARTNFVALGLALWVLTIVLTAVIR